MLGVEAMRLSLSDERIRGVAIASARHRPCIAWNSECLLNNQEWGRRFTLAHELCHLLFDWDVGRGLAVASGPWAPFGIERRANAFAAMLLMPTDAVQRAVAPVTAPLETLEGVAMVARRLGTSFQSTLRHLNNLGYVDETIEERLVQRLSAQQR